MRTSDSDGDLTALYTPLRSLLGGPGAPQTASGTPAFQRRGHGADWAQRQQQCGGGHEMIFRLGITGLAVVGATTAALAVLGLAWERQRRQISP